MRKDPRCINVVVNKTNIKKGVVGVASSCPISLAIQREISAKRKSLKVSVHENGVVYIFDRNCELTKLVGTSYKERQKIAKFIRNFDDNKVVEPTVFTFRYLNKEV
jgi:hypothetical protein